MNIAEIMPDIIIGFVSGALAIAIFAGLGYAHMNAKEQEETQEEAAADDLENSDQLIKSRDWGGDDSEILARVAMYYGTENIETGKLAILACLNQVWTRAQAGERVSIETVAYEMTDGCYAFCNPTLDYYVAVSQVQYDGWDESQGALYIADKDDEEVNAMQERAGRSFLYTSGGYNFYK